VLTFGWQFRFHGRLCLKTLKIARDGYYSPSTPTLCFRQQSEHCLAPRNRRLRMKWRSGESWVCRLANPEDILLSGDEGAPHVYNGCVLSYGRERVPVGRPGNFFMKTFALFRLAIDIAALRGYIFCHPCGRDSPLG
jgi:hypothetical protein